MKIVTVIRNQRKSPSAFLWLRNTLRENGIQVFEGFLPDFLKQTRGRFEAFEKDLKAGSVKVWYFAEGVVADIKDLPAFIEELRAGNVDKAENKTKVRTDAAQDAAKIEEAARHPALKEEDMRRRQEEQRLAFQGAETPQPNKNIILARDPDVKEPAFFRTNSTEEEVETVVVDQSFKQHHDATRRDYLVKSAEVPRFEAPERRSLLSPVQQLDADGVPAEVNAGLPSEVLSVVPAEVRAASEAPTSGVAKGKGKGRGKGK